ncbi:MAG: YfiT family bacillithiol transferase [Terriglobales bacterium]
MTTAAAPDLSYPIGKFQYAGSSTSEQRAQYIREIEETPARLRDAVRGLNEQQIETPYRPGGWTVRKVVHHVPESHMNAYVRFKLALTEENPTVKPYKEDLWAKTPDVAATPLEVSLALLENLHRRWVMLLKSLTAADLERTLQHPELGQVKLDRYLAMYAWHGKHHVAHITALRQRNEW